MCVLLATCVKTLTAQTWPGTGQAPRAGTQHQLSQQDLSALIAEWRQSPRADGGSSAWALRDRVNRAQLTDAERADRLVQLHAGLRGTTANPEAERAMLDAASLNVPSWAGRMATLEAGRIRFERGEADAGLLHVHQAVQAMQNARSTEGRTECAECVLAAKVEAALLRKAGRLGGAIQAWDNVISLPETTLVPFDSAWARVEKARCQREMGQPLDARQTLSAALDILRNAGDTTGAAASVALERLAITRNADTPQAFRAACEAILHDELLREHKQTLSVVRNLAHSLRLCEAPDAEQAAALAPWVEHVRTHMPVWRSGLGTTGDSGWAELRLNLAERCFRSEDRQSAVGLLCELDSDPTVPSHWRSQIDDLRDRVMR
jgi:tetratricopeptide (TPR) repeat protein